MTDLEHRRIESKTLSGTTFFFKYSFGKVELQHWSLYTMILSRAYQTRVSQLPKMEADSNYSLRSFCFHGASLGMTEEIEVIAAEAICQDRLYSRL